MSCVALAPALSSDSFSTRFGSATIRSRESFDKACGAERGGPWWNRLRFDVTAEEPRQTGRRPRTDLNRASDCVPVAFRQLRLAEARKAVRVVVFETNDALDLERTGFQVKRKSI